MPDIYQNLVSLGVILALQKEEAYDTYGSFGRLLC
jgi:hypothetical protein